MARTGAIRIPTRSGIVTLTGDAITLQSTRLVKVALTEVRAIECQPGLVSCAVRIEGPEALELDGVLFGDALRIIMHVGFDRLRAAPLPNRATSISATSLDGKSTLQLRSETLSYNGSSCWSIPVQEIESVIVESDGAATHLAFSRAEGTIRTESAMQSAGTLRLLLALVSLLHAPAETPAGEQISAPEGNAGNDETDPDQRALTTRQTRTFPCSVRAERPRQKSSAG